MTENIAGKVVVITGASSGLGEAAARRLAAAGARVALGARRAARIEALAAELAQGGGEALARATDVTVAAQVQQLVDAAVQRWGRLDDWDRMIDVNIKGVLYGIAAALPVMQRQMAGQIINVASVAGHKVGPGAAVYSATKAAVRMLSEGLRQEVKPWNIRTTVISPGAVDTELPASATEADVLANMQKFYADIAIPADSFARAVVYAMGQPDDVDVNEILYRPTRQMY
jgi:NADP-dependent 3-hydroxy acid dehydrogenase YdfG